MRILDGIYEEVRDDSTTIVKALTAGGGPLYPPADWYTDPKLDQVTPMTVTADGRVYGHIAPWQQEHIGLPPGTKPPRSRTDYQFFKTGVVKLDNGDEATVGQITLSGGHAPMTADASEAVKHYDDTASAIADVTIGEDQHGIWVSGGLRPEVTDEQVRVIRASAVSGDWRPLNGGLELVAVCQVNVPGFPTARAMVASGEVTALVAAGASYMFGLQQEDMMFSELKKLEQRVQGLEDEALIAAGGNPFGKKKKSETEVKDGEDDDDTRKEDAKEDAKPDDVKDDSKKAVDDEKRDSKDDSVKDDPEAAKRAALKNRFKNRK